MRASIGMTLEQFMAKLKQARKSVRANGIMRRLYRKGLWKPVFNREAWKRRRDAFFAKGGEITKCEVGFASGCLWVPASFAAVPSGEKDPRVKSFHKPASEIQGAWSQFGDHPDKGRDED